ncbi:hypothetical protein [Aurantiacibacter spongiae]|uniref:Uncharacterized protein n=1 Tax=Aurantiacibacter spongiae TaxID=2488860 RepID=A0A3N5DI62_9SPHN|nr:hypothetical protein [Aurantiacibacter spongiae]RPF70315.1 hypothetical protein EG799_00730 [Aurantiacibacter spongiae]
MTPQKRARLYLRAAVMGFAGTVLSIAGEIWPLPDFVRGLAVGILLVSLLLLLIRRFRDEFIEQLWNAGASLAFVAVVFVYLFAPFAEGVVDGISVAAPRQDFLASSWVGSIALLAFFIGFHIKWLRASL